MGNTLQEIIAELEKVASPAETTSTSAQSTAAPVENQVNENDELRKLAEEYDAAGRIMARAFADELEKIAVGATGVTPNTAEEGDNPAVQLSNSDIQLAEVGKVEGAIKTLTQGGERDNTAAGSVQVQTPMTIAPTSPSVASDAGVALAADASKAQAQMTAAGSVNKEKTAATDVVERLWQHYFGS